MLVTKHMCFCAYFMQEFSIQEKEQIFYRNEWKEENERSNVWIVSLTRKKFMTEVKTELNEWESFSHSLIQERKNPINGAKNWLSMVTETNYWNGKRHNILCYSHYLILNRSLRELRKYLLLCTHLNFNGRKNFLKRRSRRMYVYMCIKLSSKS